MRPVFKRILFIYTLLLTSIFAEGQQTFLRNYTVDDGLPSSETYHVIQDSKGYIWIATNQGVSRFDGRTFKNYDIQNGLPENTVFEIYEDDLKRLWFVSYPFQLSYFENDSIHKYKYNELLRDLAGHGLVPIKKSFRADADDNVFFSFINNRKLYRIDSEGEIEILDQINDDYALSITQLGNDLLSAQTDTRSNSSLIKINTDKIHFTTKAKSLRDGKYSYSHFTMALSDEGDIYHAQNELLTIIKTNNTQQLYKFKTRFLWVSYHQKFIWVGNELSGASKFVIGRIQEGPEETVLDGKSVSSVLVDQQGGEWFTTLESGLFYRPSTAFKSFSHANGLSGDIITSIESFNNKIYLGTSNGFLDILKNDHIEKTINLNKKVVKVKAFKQEILWVGTETYLYSFENNSTKKYANNHKDLIVPGLSSLLVFSIKDILPISKNEIWLGQMQSLSTLKNGNVIYDSYIDIKKALRVEALDLLAKDTFLLGTFTGLWQYSDGQFTFVGKENKLLNQRITDILVTHLPEFQLLGTKGSGLVIKKGKQIYQITKTNGLSSNSITSLLRVNNEIWIATNNGLNIIAINDLENKNPFIRVFKKEHGLISDEINEIKAVGNKVYIASNGGLTILDRSLYRPSALPPPVYIEKVSIDGKVFGAPKGITLKADQKFLKIIFSGIDFRDAGNLKFKYRLAGIDDIWITTSNSEADYSFLPSGNYRFEVMAINSEWHISKPTVLYIRVEPPFWETGWFMICSFIFIVILIYFIVRLSLQRVRKKHNLQNDINRYRQEALIKQMDPHFVFNTLNSIQSFVMRNDSYTSSQYLIKFSRLMRLILNNSQKKSITLSEEIESLNLYMELESMRFTQQFTYKIDLESNVDTDLIKIPAFIIQPFIENSIWHGIMNLQRRGSIYIKIQKVKNYFTITIEDNGVGRKQSDNSKTNQISDRRSMGLYIIESRLVILCKTANIPLKLEFIDLYDKSGEPAGTRVIFNLPVIK